MVVGRRQCQFLCSQKKQYAARRLFRIPRHDSEEEGIGKKKEGWPCRADNGTVEHGRERRAPAVAWPPAPPARWPQSYSWTSDCDDAYYTHTLARWAFSPRLSFLSSNAKTPDFSSAAPDSKQDRGSSPPSGFFFTCRRRSLLAAHGGGCAKYSRGFYVINVRHRQCVHFFQCRLFFLSAPSALVVPSS